MEYNILVIMLSIALLISLLVWIVVGVLAVKVLKKVKAASDVAAQAVDNVEEFTQSLKGAGKATAVGSTIAQIMNVINKGRK